MRGKAFTLVEVLVSGAILFVVSAAVVSLSNSITQGTERSSDNTVMQGVSAEGLELVGKIRDDTVTTPLTLGADKLWFGPAASVAEYGWYRLDPIQNGSQTIWQLDPTTYGSDPIAINGSSDIDSLAAKSENVNLNGLAMSRLICIEAVGADSSIDLENSSKSLRCNKNTAGTAVDDGDRSSPASAGCQTNDVYCQMTQASINASNLLKDKLIGPGNAVKVRSVIVVNNRGTAEIADTATVLTNNRSLIQ